jgi:hypothetical protein
MNSMNNTDRLAMIINEMEGNSRSLATKLLNNPNITITFNPTKPTIDEIKNATPGETLVDNSVLVFCNSKFALIAAPNETEIKSNWYQKELICDKLNEHGFNPDEWFIPTVGQLYLTYVMCKNAFSATYYWSSTEASSTTACYVNFTSGRQGTNSKTNSNCVRAFREVFFDL